MLRGGSAAELFFKKTPVRDGLVFLPIELKWLTSTSCISNFHEKGRRSDYVLVFGDFQRGGNNLRLWRTFYSSSLAFRHDHDSWDLFSIIICIISISHSISYFTFMITDEWNEESRLRPELSRGESFCLRL